MQKERKKMNIEELIDDVFDEDNQKALQEYKATLKKKVEDMKDKEFEIPFITPPEGAVKIVKEAQEKALAMGYNQAIKDILKELNQ